MNARKFIAANSREALKMVRAELGEDAVILSNRKAPQGVEIVAMGNAELMRLSEARENRPAQPAKPLSPLHEKAMSQAAVLGAKVISTAPAASEKPVAQARASAPAAAAAPVVPTPEVDREQTKILSEIKVMHNMLQEQLACMAWGDMQQRNPKRGGLLRDMINSGFSPALSRKLLDKMPDDADASWLRQALAHNVQVVGKQDDIITRGGVYALVGPTGVGKTTTTAKLAARAVVRYGADKVALITTDSYRIGAHEQLKIYGKILGVAVHAVRDTEDLKRTLSGLKHKHLVLIDTMGVGQRDSRVASQMEMFNAAGVKRLLLLNATSAGSTLEDVVRMYHGAGVVGCIATKLDEAVALGTVLDVVIRHKLTMHYIASGQRVPEDLHDVNLEYLLHRAFKINSAQTAFELQDMELPAFMAGSAPAKRAAHAL